MKAESKKAQRRVPFVKSEERLRLYTRIQNLEARTVELVSENARLKRDVEMHEAVERQEHDGYHVHQVHILRSDKPTTLYEFRNNQPIAIVHVRPGDAVVVSRRPSDPGMKSTPFPFASGDLPLKGASRFAHREA